jgi:diguanylate cyclase (GGDEF)-like protein
MFLFANLSYTGHGYGLFWPDSAWLQKWMNPISLSLFSSSGVLFAFSFLKIRQLHPGLYKKTLLFCTLIWILQIVLMTMGKQNASVMIAIFFVGFFSVFTFYAAIISLQRGHRDALYYLIATITTLLGTAITALTVWAIIPYSTLGYRAAEIGISVDALLLSIALAEYIRRTQREKVQAQQLARIDMLTSLNNRRAFAEISMPLWHNAVRHQQKLCVILLDIDKFKNINDNYGHTAGDKVLQKVASVLNTIVREGDVLARWGGEEFAIMLPQTSLAQAFNMAERIRENISDLQILHDNAVIKTTVSIGVAERDDNTDSIDKLFTVADVKLYQAKESGRDKVCATN